MNRGTVEICSKPNAVGIYHAWREWGINIQKPLHPFVSHPGHKATAWGLSRLSPVWN